MQDIRWAPPACDGIRERTRTSTNVRIDRATQDALDDAASSPERARARLSELDREWNVDRALMLNFAVLATVAATLALRGMKRHGRFNGFGYMLFTQLGFLAHHALRRWCPPMPLFRRLGFRSDHEIAQEKALLEAALAKHDDHNRRGW